MKIFLLTFLLAVSMVDSLHAQPAPRAITPEQEAAMRRALDEAYGRSGVTTGAVQRPLFPNGTTAAVRNATGPYGQSNPPPAGAVIPAPTSPNLAGGAVIPGTNRIFAESTGAPTNAAVPPAAVIPTVRPVPGTVSGPVTPRSGAGAPPPVRPNAAGAIPTPGGGVVIPTGPPSPGAVATPPAGAGVAGGVGATNISTLSALDDPTALPDDQILQPGVIKFQDADLLQVLDVYQELTGRTILRPAQLPAQKISIRSQTPLTRRQAVQALDSVLALNQITMIPSGTLFVKAVPFGQAFGEAPAFNENPVELLPESGSYVTHVVQLKNQVPSQLVQALQPFSKMPNSILAIDSSGILVLRDYAENVKRMMELLDQIDVVPVQDFEPIVIPIRYALAADIAEVLSSLTAGGGGATTVGSSQSRTGLTGPGGGGLGGGGGQGGFGNQGGFGGGGGYNQNQRYGLQGGVTPMAVGGAGALGARGGAAGGGAAAGGGTFQDRLRSIVNRAAQGDIVVLGDTKIIADERTNSLLIFASKQDIATIRDIIDKLDVVLPQVVIEAIIMEVRLGDELDYGISYLQTDPTRKGNFTGIGGIANRDVPFLTPGAFSTLGSNALGGGFSYLGKFGNEFEATVRAAASDSRINVLSRPRIQTSHAVEANLFVGNTVPYVTGTYVGFSGNPQTQFQQQQIGITLSVLPLINPEGLVVMDIRQKIQSIGREIAIDANFSVPETIDREANAKVSVQDRETVILGGFISSDLDTAKSGVPILKDIPILGNLFRSNSRRRNRNELIVLIRPTVLPTPEEASLFATDERSRLPGIVEAERDFSMQEKKRQKKMQKEMMEREGLTPAN